MTQRAVIVHASDRPPTTGQLIRYYRAAKNLSQEGLGELVDITGQTIGKYESGRYVKDDLLRKIADALGVSFRDLRPDEDLEPDEALLLMLFRQASKRDKKLLLGVAKNVGDKTLHEGDQAGYSTRK